MMIDPKSLSQIRDLVADLLEKTDDPRAGDVTTVRRSPSGDVLVDMAPDGVRTLTVRITFNQNMA